MIYLLVSYDVDVIVYMFDWVVFMVEGVIQCFFDCEVLVNGEYWMR